MLKELLQFMLVRTWRALRRGRAVHAAGDERLALSEQWVATGDLARERGDLDGAETCYRTALAFVPDSVPAHRSLGRLLRATGRPAYAVTHLRSAYAIAPDAPGALHELVSVLIELDLVDKALSVAALRMQDESYEARLCLGIAYQKLHDPQRALACFEVARRLRPDDAELYDRRGAVLQELGRFAEAMADFEHSLALRPGFALAAFHRSLLRLLMGDFERGWQEYELRRTSADHVSTPTVAPRWDGGSLRGRTILVRREQGLGDEIMFASMLPDVIRLAGHCIVECEPKLLGLFRRSFPAATVFGSLPDRGLPYAIARSGIDVEGESGSLALHLRTRAADFPRHTGYLAADPNRIARWRERLAQLGPGPKVGISWTGGVRKTRRALRSIALPDWLPILTVPGVRFVSVQYTPEAGSEAAAMHTSHGIRIEHWPEAIDDYEETAALVCALDLVISVCTSVVHLCGGLGKPVWVMAPYVPEWRYGSRGETMPWYPSVRLFRSPAFGEWNPVIKSVSEALHEL